MPAVGLGGEDAGGGRRGEPAPGMTKGGFGGVVGMTTDEGGGFGDLERQILPLFFNR